MMIPSRLIQTILLATFVICVSTQTSQADQTFEYPKNNPVLAITYPKSWKVAVEDGAIMATTSSGTVSTVLAPIDGASVEKAVDDAINGITDELSNFTLNGDMQETTINEFATAFFEGTGKAADGSMVNASCAVLTPDGENFFMLMIFEQQDLSKRDSADVDKVLGSLTKP